MVFLAHRLRIAASVIAVMLAVGWSLSSIAPAQGLDPANEQRCLDAERDLLAEAQKQGLGKIVGINDNLLLIEDQRLTVAQLAEEQRAVFEHACRALLAGDPQDELEHIADEVERVDGSDAGDVVWPLVGVVIGGGLTFFGGWLLQRHEQRSARVSATKDRVLDAVSAAEAWVRVKGQESPAISDVVAARKAEALAAGTTLLSALSMAMRDPWLVGGGKSVESLPPLYKCAEAIFGDEGHIADNDAVAAKQGLEDLNAMARTAVTPPTLI